MENTNFSSQQQFGEEEERNEPNQQPTEDVTEEEAGTEAEQEGNDSQNNTKATGKKRMQCPVCDRLVSSSSYNDHMRIHTGTDMSECHICHRFFTRKDSVNLHILNVHGKANQPLICDLCGKHYSTLKSLQVHVSVHLGLRYKCRTCKNRFEKQSCLRKHQTICAKGKQKEQLIKCQLCGKELTCYTSLKSHRERHIGEKNFQCSLCPARFKTIQDKRTHLKRVHTNHVPCPICNKTFAKNSLRGHLYSHTDRPFKCDQCGKGFKQQKKLRRHLSTVHATEKAFTCDICGKKFTSEDYVAIHIARCHTDQRCKCEICNKELANLRSLKKHSLIHTGQKSIPCEICNRMFLRKEEVRRHMMSHTDEKKYKCNICGEHLKYLTSYKRHMTAVHAVKG